MNVHLVYKSLSINDAIKASEPTSNCKFFDLFSMQKDNYLLIKDKI